MLARHPAAAAVSGLRYVPTPDCFFRGDDPLELLRGVPGLLVLDIRPREPTDPAALEPFTCNLVIEALSTAPADEIRTVFRLVPDQAEIATVPAAGPPWCKFRSWCGSAACASTRPASIGSPTSRSNWWWPRTSSATSPATPKRAKGCTAPFWPTRRRSGGWWAS